MKYRKDAKCMRNSIKDTLSLEKAAKNLSLEDISEKEGIIFSKKNELTNTAKILYQSQKEDNTTKLHTLFKQISLLDQEIRMVIKLKQAILYVQMAKDQDLANEVLHNYILDTYNKQKLRGLLKPSLKSVEKKATRLQINRDLEQSLFEDISSLMKEDNETQSDAIDEGDQQFINWLDSLKPKKPISCNSDESCSFQKRLEQIKRQ